MARRSAGDPIGAATLLSDVSRRIGASLDLQETLDAIASAVVETLGFGVAVLNLVAPDGDLDVVAAAGDPQACGAMLGRRQRRSSWEALMAAAQQWGPLRFLDGRVTPPEEADEMYTWVPDLPVPPDEDPVRWHPLDCLFAPLVTSEGRLLGVLSVDLPLSGRRPDPEQRALLAAFAVEAALAIEHAEIHSRLNRSEATFRRVFDESPIGMALFDERGRYHRVNNAYAGFLGRPASEVVGRPMVDFTHPDDLAATRRMVRQIRSGRRRVFRVEQRYLHADGRTVYGRLSLTRLDASYGHSVLAQLEDVTEIKEAERELVHRALHDSLTGLPNRALVLDRLAGALHRARRAGGGRGSAVALAFCDLDHFKLVNDSRGHSAGDELLVLVARALRTTLRPQDTAGRFGGDEFVVVCEGLDGPEDAVALAERIQLAVRAATTADRLPAGLRMPFMTGSASIGLALAHPGSTPDSLLAEADAALYRAKAAGRGRWEMFDAAMRERATAALTLRRDLDAALAREEFLLHYQPVVRLHGPPVAVGYEALLRWEHPERGLLPPGVFLDLVEEGDADLAVTDWVLRTAAAAAVRLSPEADGPFISVNISPRQLGRSDLPHRVAATLRATGLPASRLCVEITERHLLSGQAGVDDVSALCRLGVRVALDDFGTGYSGLSSLQHLPVHALKLDRGFIAPLGTDRRTAGIVAAVVDLARVLGLEVVAEGVETAEQVELLQEMGVDLAQGSHFGPPALMPVLRPPNQRRPASLTFDRTSA
jgi:diguanylate cyclase (GGDEF)-like protein/PAS domain S-box-containing protein